MPPRRAPRPVLRGAPAVLPRRAGVEAGAGLRPREDGLAAHGAPRRGGVRAVPRYAPAGSEGAGRELPAYSASRPAGSARAATRTCTRPSSAATASRATPPPGGSRPGPRASTTGARPTRSPGATRAWPARSATLPGRPMRVKHERCSDCHGDAHGGELARRADGGRCESCHDVEGFRPARYAAEDHAKTAYPLKGAHLGDRVRRVPPAGSRRGARACAGRRSRARAARSPLKLAATRCIDCHRDPHSGETASRGRRQAPARPATGWSRGARSASTTPRPATRFRAGTRRWPAPAATRAPIAPSPRGCAFKGAATECAACHDDPHAGQFAASARQAARRASAATPPTRCRPRASRTTRALALQARRRHARLRVRHLPQARATATASASSATSRCHVTCVGCHGNQKTAAIGGPR